MANEVPSYNNLIENIKCIVVNGQIIINFSWESIPGGEMIKKVRIKTATYPSTVIAEYVYDASKANTIGVYTYVYGPDYNVTPSPLNGHSYVTVEYELVNTDETPFISATTGTIAIYAPCVGAPAEPQNL